MKYLVLFLILYVVVGFNVAAHSLYHSAQRAKMAGRSLITDDRFIAKFWVVMWLPFAVLMSIIYVEDFFAWLLRPLRLALQRR